MKVFPYVYKVVNRNTKEFYIGYREANKLPSSVDILHYKTSSVKVKHRFVEFDPIIIAEFFTDSAADDAYWFEQKLISENINDPLCLNDYYIKYGSGKKFKSRKGRKCKDETKQKISKTKNTIDLVTGLSNAQKCAIISVKTRMENNSYVSGTQKANETKLKKGSNIIGGKKSSITKNTIDPVTGLTNAQKSAEKMKQTKNTIDPVTGLTNAQLAGLKLKETLRSIDPSTGLTIKQLQIQKANETKLKNGSLLNGKNPNAKHIQIYDKDGCIRYDCQGTFVQLCKDENLSYTLFMRSAKEGKKISYNKSPFYGWYAVLLDRS